MYENVILKSNIYVYKENICFLNGEGVKFSKLLIRFLKLFINFIVF